MLTNPTIEQLKQYGLLCGNFDTFKDIANSLLSKDCGRIFDHATNGKEEFEVYSEQSVKNADGMLGVIEHAAGNWHVLAIIDYDGKNVTAYDPDSGKIEIRLPSEFNRDCVIFKKTTCS